MKALVFDGRLKLVADYPRPDPGPGEVRVRTLLAGICNTDLEVVRGYASFAGVLGHEFVGVVDEAEDQGLIGQRAVGEINAGCGRCPTCRMGLPQHCRTRATLGIRGQDGTLAEYFLLPAANLHRVPEGVSDRAAVFTEPLAAACEIPEQVGIRPTDHVLVLGDGKLGQLAAQVLALTGCHLAVVGRHPEKLALLSARGIATFLEGQAAVGMADVVVEATGSSAGFQAAERLVRPRGTIVLKSTYYGSVHADLSDLVVREVRVIGSRCGPFEPALRLLARGLVDVAPLIHAEYPLDEAVAAVQRAGEPGVLKVLVRAGAID